jgi:Dephospho-CoA kinase
MCKKNLVTLFLMLIMKLQEYIKKIKNVIINLKKKLPNYITSFPIKKKELTDAIISNQKNLKKITQIIHPEVRNRMNNFIKKNKDKKLIILDIPLLIENKLNKKKDILIFVDAKKKEINKRLKKRTNFNGKILKKFQLPVEFKKKKADFIIKNNFRSNSIKKSVKIILKKILLNA